MKTIQQHCPSLGADLVGEQDAEAGLALFRGIPYASLSKRWTQSSLRDSLSSPFDATKFGPKCPQTPHTSTIPMQLEEPVVEADEFDCLNLNITTPTDALISKEERTSSRLLPVMIWVHGGRFRNGSNTSARYEPRVLSSLAKSAGHPIVLVQINYRLDVFGFIASSDLATEQKKAASDSSESLGQGPDFFANFGLVDQRNAFLWVQKHIQDFGGDPSNVTAVGVSAGSASLHMHILSGDPIFDRAILMSGSAPVMGPLPLKYLEVAWTKLCQNAGVSEATPEKKLESLRSLSAESILEKSVLIPALGPVADGRLLPTAWHLGTLSAESRCKEIIVGDVRMEGIIFDAILSRVPQAAFRNKVQAVFKNAADVDHFCNYFGFSSSGEQSFEAFRDAMRLFLSVAIFHFPALRVAENFAGKVYYYHFEEPSPYEGPTYGLPVHGQCAVFLYNNEKALWPESAQKVSSKMADVWTAFAYGEEPWEPFTSSNQFMRFGPAGECSIRSIEDDKTRDYGYLGWLRGHFEETFAVLQGLM